LPIVDSCVHPFLLENRC